MSLRRRYPHSQHALPGDHRSSSQLYPDLGQAEASSSSPMSAPSQSRIQCTHHYDGLPGIEPRPHDRLARATFGELAASQSLEWLQSVTRNSSRQSIAAHVISLVAGDDPVYPALPRLYEHLHENRIDLVGERSDEQHELYPVLPPLQQRDTSVRLGDSASQVIKDYETNPPSPWRLCTSISDDEEERDDEPEFEHIEDVAEHPNPDDRVGSEVTICGRRLRLGYAPAGTTARRLTVNEYGHVVPSSYVSARVNTAWDLDTGDSASASASNQENNGSTNGRRNNRTTTNKMDLSFLLG